MKTLLLLCAFVIGVCPFADAQQSGKVPRIGYLSAIESAGEADALGGIRLALRDFGYIEGQNIAIEYRYAEGKLDRFATLADELVHLKVDVIVAAGGNLLIRAVKSATTAIPIVMVGRGSDPVAAGLVESLARPGGNVSGLTNLSGELGGKRLELLKETIPKALRVAVLYDPTTPSGVREVKELLPIEARALGLAIEPRQIRGADDFEKVFAAINNRRLDGLYVPTGPLLRANVKRVAGLALKSRLPSIYELREAVDFGGLMYYGADLAHGYRRVAMYVDRILKGAKPANLPVERPTKFELLINLKSAKQLGLTIPSSVLAKADKVIK